MLRKIQCFLLFNIVCIQLQVVGVTPDREGDIRGTIGSLLYFIKSEMKDHEQSLIHLSKEDVELLWAKLFSLVEGDEFDQLNEAYTLCAKAFDGEELCFGQAFEKVLPLWLKRSIWGEESLNLELTARGKSKRSYNDFKTNPYTSKTYKKNLHQYVMAVDHPIKQSLDNLFLANRVTLNEQTFMAAGFSTRPTNDRSYITVGKNPVISGYLVKVYLDSELDKKRGLEGWKWFARRCELARKIAAVIKKKRCYYFTVPEKWIYPLPLEPSVPDEASYERKNEILVVQDMHLTTKEESLSAWLNMTEKHLKQLYTIISYAGGSSYREDNIPYTKNGKFAFIDTEYPDKTPNYGNVLHYLSPEMQDYWKQLVQKGGLVYKE